VTHVAHTEAKDVQDCPCGCGQCPACCPNDWPTDDHPTGDALDVVERFIAARRLVTLDPTRPAD